MQCAGIEEFDNNDRFHDFWDMKVRSTISH